MMLKELPKEEQPRERLMRYGIKKLTNEELLAILIRSGTKNYSVKDLAMIILKTLNNLTDLNKISIHKLSKIKGIGNVKAMSIIAALELGKRVYLSKETKDIKINNSELVYQTFKNKFKFETQEKLLAVYLDPKNKVIDYKIIFIGTVNSSTVHPREIFKEALNLSASKIIIIHNHPSGDPSPSIADILFTKQIIKTGEIMAIPLIDHLIIGHNKYSSYLKDKWWDEN